MSHPSRVRGLKSYVIAGSSTGYYVAPFTGAWIEISIHRLIRAFSASVAPFTGAWIEIFLKIINFSVDNVAPFTGAWIEIKVLAADEYRNPRRTLHGCVD